MVQYDFDESCIIAASNHLGEDDAGREHEYARNSWFQAAETNLPLTASKLGTPGRVAERFQSSMELRSRKAASKVILVNFISLFINLVLAVIGFYFSFTKNSTASSAFAADCVLDLLSSAILLWRYHGDLNSVYMHAREQIACIYLGVLFEVSAVGIIIKSINDMNCDTSALEYFGSDELVYLSVAATIACSVLTVFKCDLYKTLRDKSILLDVFAMSIVVSQALIKIDPTFWFLDPVLSILLGAFMIGFGANVIHQNFNVLKPIGCSLSRIGSVGERLCNETNKHTALIGNRSMANGRNSDKSVLLTASGRHENFPILMKDGKSNYCTITLS